MLSKVTLPYAYGILLPAINFLYTDTCPEIVDNESIDFICKVMVVADQLFISRLKEMCEVALANLLSLKYYPELCQFAHVYNAPQLKQCCMEFISLNLTTVLETRGLDNLESELIDDLTEYYCKFNPIMSSRIITPFYNAVEDCIIEEFAKQFPLDLNIIDEEVKKDHSLIDTSVKKKNKQSKKLEYTVSEKERMRYESVSSVTSLDLSNETGDITLSLSKVKEEKGAKEKQEKWIEVPSSQKQQKVVQARLKAINAAKELLNEAPAESFTKLTKNSSAINITTNTSDYASTSRLSISPKDSPMDAQLIWSPQGNMTISHVGPKLSQKQRKKLALQGEQIPLNSPQNLNDYFTKLSVSPEKPKNPWKICEPPIASSSPKAKSLEFNQILTDQRKQKEDFSRIMTKPLAMTQVRKAFYVVFELKVRGCHFI